MGEVKAPNILRGPVRRRSDAHGRGSPCIRFCANFSLKTKMPITILTALALVSAVLTILASYQKRRLTLYLFKPLTIIFIIVIAIQPKHPVSAFYGYAILAGLVLSLVGDIFLMLPDEQFIAGLVSFLLAHICYITAL